ncbi:mitotic checkpoint serine/threonine-protein kinase BUB1-like isoform X1 [Temnothorax curvispinosus]|uniref:Mitotic checkpoint serine/threonine-protein kinase BUB1-like isoform X1 n=1 Tax=Temnothorax curvispinosus TaxID=300111 RepID=A0A6J1RF11_9HYME|nr:mitotic checkpoint serine/threonine-protein kinase BUB1-like isoform X1 [Temnothorax curvispinosus]
MSEYNEAYVTALRQRIRTLEIEMETRNAEINDYCIKINDQKKLISESVELTKFVSSNYEDKMRNLEECMKLLLKNYNKLLADSNKRQNALNFYHMEFDELKFEIKNTRRMLNLHFQKEKDLLNQLNEQISLHRIQLEEMTSKHLMSMSILESQESIERLLEQALQLNSENVDTMECEEHEPMEQVEEEMFELPSRDINPFDKNLIAGLLKKIKFPQPHHADGYKRIDADLNKLLPSELSTTITLDTEAYDLKKCLGKGKYGTVFKAVNLQTGETVALKTQRPAWVWEYYIVREIKTRLTNPHMLRGFMDVTMAYVANNGSVLVSEYSKYETLSSVTEQIKIVCGGKPLMETLSIFFTIEMLQIVEYLHKCQIIHGDIKPDNFLLMRLPTQDVRPTIQLIDFGSSIDMKLLPENTTFTQVIKTGDFSCIEMQTGRPWTYQTDLYCLAATSHYLLFGNNMRVSNIDGRWFIASKLPRYTKKAAWEQFFTELLNIESCEKMPDLAKLRNMMEETLAQVPEVQTKIRAFSTLLRIKR